MYHLGTIKISTERLVLRQFNDNDGIGIFNSYINDEKFLYYANKEKVSLEQIKQWLSSIDKKYENKEYYNWVITLKDNEVIGAINLRVDNDNDLVWLNYAIGNRHNNLGYMTEALNAVKDFGLNNLKVRKIIGGCELNNIASQRVMEKCGFKFEEVRENELLLKDGLHDLKIFSITNNL